MEASLVKTVVISLLLFHGGSVHAGNLCDAACSLSITFPGGGQIDAVEPLTITFGDTGLVDTAGSLTAYLDGETLTLNAGESLVFGNGGTFDIGTVGNIDYTNMAITTDGQITLTAVGGGEQIQIPPSGRLAVVNASLTIHSSFTISGTLDLSAATIHIPDAGAPAASGCDIDGSSGTTLTSTNASPLVLGNSSDCDTLYLQISEAALDGVGSVSIVDTQTDIVAGTLTLSNGDVNVAGPLATADEEDSESAGSAGIYFQLLFFGLFLLAYLRPARATTELR